MNEIRWHHFSLERSVQKNVTSVGVRYEKIKTDLTCLNYLNIGTKEQLEKALEEINNGSAVRAAAKKYGIPKATLHFRILNPNSKNAFGPLPFLTAEEEKAIEEWLFDMSKRGFPRKADDILDSVQNYLNQHPRETPFQENRPGKGWLKGFLKRHPRITQRAAEGVTYASACVSESDIRNWFNLVMTELIKCDLLDILEDPSRIFNADESGFGSCPNTGKVFSERGAKNVYIVEKANAKESMTVLFTISADGQMVLPTIVYPYQRLPDRIRQTVPNEWGVATSSSGWMTADTFKYIIQHIFHPFLVKNNVKFPVLLFVDGHRSHLTYELSMLARSLQIEIFALYPNSTRILQPADVSLFRPVKQFWKAAVKEWQQDEGEIVTKQNFALILKKVTDKISPACIINGFRACGLYPFDPNAVDYSKCIAPPKPVPSTTENTEISNNESDRTLPFSKFMEIVGPEMISKFKDIKNILQDVENNESFFILYQIWEFYNSKSNTNEDANLKAIESNEGENIDPTPTTSTNNVQREEIVNVFTENDERINRFIDEILECDKEQDNILQLETMDEQHNNNCDHQTCETEERTNTFNNDIEYSSQDPSIQEANATAAATLPTEELITLGDLGVPNTCDSEINLNQPSCSTATDIKDFLRLPSTPSRKGKRNVERLPYHISGLEYQRILENKLKEKQRLELEKIEKKLEREQKKEDKKRKIEEMKAKKLEKKKKLEYPLSSCGACKAVVKVIKLRCCECTHAYHRSCIPKAHLIHVPQEEGDNFLCHKCFIMDNDEDINDNENSDQENEDFLNIIRKGEAELGVNYLKF